MTLPDGSRRRLGFRAPAADGGRSAQELDVRSCGSARPGSVGWYKAWELGEWASPDPVPLFDLFSANAVDASAILGGPRARAAGSTRWRIAFATTSRSQAKANIAAHYDLGNDFYSAWLDETMTYSSARFAAAEDSLEAAQLRKIHLLLDRLDLEPGTAPAGDRLRLGNASRSRRRSAASTSSA